MKKIPLTQGKFALVDDADYDWLMQWKWFARRHRNGNFYAARSVRGGPTGCRTVLLHSQILGVGPRVLVDHRNQQTLDNQRGNLRECTIGQNCCNRGRTKKNTSGFKGVTKTPASSGRWAAQIQSGKKNSHLGTYESPELAARAYDAAALKYHGEFAKLNFPIETK